MVNQRGRLGRVIVLFAAAVGVGVCVNAAQADSGVILADSGLPWVDPTHQTALEQVLAPIASRTANRAVTVRCETPADWATLTANAPFSIVFGFVQTSWQTIRGIPVGAPQISTFAEISPDMCYLVQQFAIATTKPTKCTQTTTETFTVMRRVVTYVPVRRRVIRNVRGKSTTVVVTRKKRVVRSVPTDVERQVTGPPAPCYVNGQQANASDTGYWTTYKNTAKALLTIAHESIHLAGVVGGITSPGFPFGDQLAEAKANCYGMQWIPSVAQQLGASADDAIAIARFTYDQVYPVYQGTQYWSASCVPGGAMDIRADRSSTAHWP